MFLRYVRKICIQPHYYSSYEGTTCQNAPNGERIAHMLEIKERNKGLQCDVRVKVDEVNIIKSICWIWEALRRILDFI